MRAAGAPALSNSVIVNTSQTGALRETLLESGSVAALTDAQSMKRIYESLMDTYAGMIYFMFLFGVATAFAIITNTASVSLSERNREYLHLAGTGA